MLQFITDGTPLQVMSQIKSVVDNGVKWIQIRMKDASDCDIRNVIQMSKPLCHERGVTLVIDERVDLAYEFDLDGVHLGKDDMHPAEARNILGDKKIIGATANSLDDVIRVSAMPIDYIGLGPLRYTTTKKRLAPVLGLDGIISIFNTMEEKGINIPVVVIGGIKVADIGPLISAGAWGVAVSGAIAHVGDIAEAARSFLAEDKINCNIVSERKI